MGGGGNWWHKVEEQVKLKTKKQYSCYPWFFLYRTIGIKVFPLELQT